MSSLPDDERTALMAVQGIHHVQLSMPPGDEDQAIGFYEELLGIPQVPKPSHLAGRGGCWFENDVVRIHLGTEDVFRAAKKAHPALLVDDLSALRQRLVEEGVTVVDDERLPGFERFYASDPFGNRLEFLERRQP